MSNPFILIARIRVKEGMVEEYLKIAKEADDAVQASEPDMLIHTFDQDPTDPLEFTWSEVYRTSEAMVHHINNPPVVAYVEKHQDIADKFEIEVYGNQLRFFPNAQRIYPPLEYRWHWHIHHLDFSFFPNNLSGQTLAETICRNRSTLLACKARELENGWAQN